MIPAYNEEKNIGKCLDELQRVVRDEHHIPYEIIVVNDNSQRRHGGRGPRRMAADPAIRIVNRTPARRVRPRRPLRPGARRRATWSSIYMADLSDDPEDVVVYYRKILEGYDCVYGSRFIKGSEVENYPRSSCFSTASSTAASSSCSGPALTI